MRRCQNSFCIDLPPVDLEQRQHELRVLCTQAGRCVYRQPGHQQGMNVILSSADMNFLMGFNTMWTVKSGQ